MATEDGRAINTTAEHPYLVRLYEQELCDKYAGNVWNREADDFNNYCTRWVEVRDLEENDYIAVPRLINDYLNKNLIGFIMMPESVKNNGVFFDLEHKDKTSNMNSFEIFEVSSEILEMFNSSFIQSSDLVNLLLDGSEQSKVFSLEPRQGILNSSGINVHTESHHLLNSSKVIGLRLPDLRSLAVASMDLTTSLAIDSLTSLVSSSGISDISRIFFLSCNSSRSSSVSENACLATEDQLIQSVLDIFSFNFSGTDKVIVPILDLQNNYLYYVYTKDIFKPFDSDANSDITFKKSSPSKP